jgi:exopolysaccharide biosynthesis WecB/TagA/CpsF family protein
MGFDPRSAEAAANIAAIGASGARLCLVALGAPKQEIFAARAHMALPSIGFVSIGAGLDFIAGAQTRAPTWVQALALEWAWRMLNSPRRLAARYAACFQVFPRLLFRAVLLRRQSGTPS